MSEEKQLIITPEVQRFKDSQGILSPIKVADMLNQPLHIVQKNIARYFEKPLINTWDTAVWLMSRRLGKSFLATKIMVTLLLTPESKIALTSHSTSLSDETFNNILRDLALIPQIQDKFRAYKKEGIIEIPSLGSRVVTASFLNAESRFVGKQFGYLVFDEFFLVGASYQQEIHNLLAPTLTTYGRTEDGIANGKTIILSTPRGTATGSLAGLKYLAGESGKKGHISFKHTIYDSPFVSHKEIEEIKASTPKDVFEQEYMVEFTKTTKTVFRNFNKEKHVIGISEEELKDMAGYSTILLGYDFGMKDGSGISFILHNPKKDTYYVFDEYYVKDMVVYDFLKNTFDKMKEWCQKLGIRPEQVVHFYDPSCREAAVIAQKDFDITMHKAKNNRSDGVDYVNTLLQGNGEAQIPRLYFRDTCTTHIDMFEYAEFKVSNGIITNQFAKDPSERASHYECCVTTVYATFSHFKTMHNTIIVV